MKRYWRDLAVAAALLLINVLLNAPLFMPGELPFRGSIGAGYASMARFFSSHPNPWGWNPFQYCGLPAEAMYLPGLSYLTALFAGFGADPVYAYRFIAGLFVCLGPVTLYFFVLHFTRSRTWAILAALSYTLFSPVYGLIRIIQNDRGIAQLPWRVQVLARYGEGPHNAGLTLLPLALIALWRAGMKGGYTRIFTAAILFAAICLLNWVAAFALATCCLLALMVWWREPGFRLRYPIAAALLAYLLACFWLTPSFINTIAFNWPTDAFNYHLLARQRMLMIGLIVSTLIILAVFRWFRASNYLIFVNLGAWVFGYLVCSVYNYGVEVIPEGRRYTLEWEMFLFLAMFEWFRIAMRNKDVVVRACAIGPMILLLISGAPQLKDYLTQGWKVWAPIPSESTLEYRLAKWMADHPPRGRVFATGGLRYRLNSYFDLQQVGGGFESGLRNREPVRLMFQARAGKPVLPGNEIRDSLIEMKTLGVEYVVVHDDESQEYYRDFKHGKQMKGLLDVAYSEPHDVIYRLPFTSFAHAVTESELPGVFGVMNVIALESYAPAIEDPARPLIQTAWEGTSRLRVTGPVPQGKVISLQVSWDPGWHATINGRPLTVDHDKIGYIVLRPAPTDRADILLDYTAPTEPKLMAGVSAIAWVLALCGAGFSLRRTSVRPL